MHCWYTCAGISPSWHFAICIPGGTRAGRNVRGGLCVSVCGGCWLPHLLTARRDGFQPIMSWARVRQLVLAHGSAVQEAETLEDWLWHLGVGGGDGRRSVVEQRSCLCALRHVYASSEGQACQGAVAPQPGLVWCSRSAVDALWSSRMGWLPCLLPSALTLGRWAVLLNGVPGTPLGTAWQAQCGSCAQRWPFTHSWNNFYLFIDRYIYIFMNGNSSGMPWCHPPGWWPSICDVLGRITRFLSRLDWLRETRWTEFELNIWVRTFKLLRVNKCFLP